MNKTFDTIEELGGCLVQHGDLNKRIYLMKWHEDSPSDLGDRLDSLAREKGYTKIFIKITERYSAPFLANGYSEEARIPGWFPDGSDYLFLGKFFSEERQHDTAQSKINEIIALAIQKADETTDREVSPLRPRKAEEKDALQIAALYKEVFRAYPFPIYDPAYIKKTMETHVDYYCIESDGQLIAASSAEKNSHVEDVEMTDFAILPSHRKQGLAQMLLKHMEGQMATQGYSLFYTIARALSAGMNITFAKNGYSFGGTLINNTFISDGIESMNVWYKKI
jgi:beta-lysine N6-acetyltransferase